MKSPKEKLKELGELMILIMDSTRKEHPKEMTKWQFLRRHFVVSALGSSRAFVRNPIGFANVVACRAHHFITRDFYPCKSIEGWDIESKQELCSYWEIFIEGGLRGKWLKKLKKQAKPLVIDVGANCGVFSRFVQKHNPRSTLEMFEPQERFFEKLTRMQCNLFAVGCSNTTGNVSFTTQDETGHVTTPDESSTSSIKVVPLDSFRYKNTFLLKIDVDGHEPQVLQGAKETLKTTRFVLVESMSKESLTVIRNELPGWEMTQLDWINYQFENPNNL
jgi:FkbM family methyltransferase